MPTSTTVKMTMEEFEVSNYNTDFLNWFPALSDFFEQEASKPSNFTPIKITPTKTHRFPMEVVHGFTDFYDKCDNRLDIFSAFWDKVKDTPDHPLTKQITAILAQMEEYRADGDDFIFIRTGLYSFKHYWKDTCTIDLKDEKSFTAPYVLFRISLLFNLVFNDLCKGKHLCPTLVVRKQIRTKPLFTAFKGDMPLNPEVRIFVDAERGLYHYQPYWLPEAIQDPSIDNWQEVLEETNAKLLSEDNLLQLADRAIRLMRHFDPNWQDKETTLKNAEKQKETNREEFKKLVGKPSMKKAFKEMIKVITEKPENILDNPLADHLLNDISLDNHQQHYQAMIGCGLIPESDYSVDFLLDENDDWHVIDIAPGKVSYQYESFKPDEELMKRINREYIDG